MAHVVLSLDLGGLERLVVDLTREGRRLGRDVSVICLERRGVLAEQIEANGGRVECLGKRPGLRPATWKRVAATLARLAPDVVHTHQVGALFYAGLPARRAGIPVLHTEHGKHYAQRQRTRWLGRLAGRYADKFCSVSADIADEVRRCRIVPERKTAVVTNGIDIQRFSRGGALDAGTVPGGGRIRQQLGIPENARVVGTIGRLSEIKRHDVLLRGFAKLASAPLAEEQTPLPHLLIVGEGPMRADLERLAEELGVRACVHFAGYQSQPERYLHLMDVFALTSRSEGMPLCILEAWAAGVPVVASSVGGVPELVRDGQTGLLFASEDVEGLAACLRRLLADAALVDLINGAARERVGREFSLQRTSETYQELYQELLARRPASGSVASGRPILS